ncbi:MAG: hypothetical protein ACTHMC_07145 [Pseudobacter sp.]|uniref:hypothetical protein n=1 Tax=Pseudobacter sp. TaxID=2045420 RepID=UPI003F7E15AB
MSKSILLQISSFLLTFQTFSQQPVCPGNIKSNTLLWTADWHPHKMLITVGGDDSLLRIYNSKTLQLVQAFQVNSMIRQLACRLEQYR